MVEKRDEDGLRTIVQATVEGARSSITVGMSCVIIGVIIGTVSLTGLGLSFGFVILRIVEKASSS